MAVNASQEGGKALDGRPQLGVLGVDLRPPGLCYLDTREVVQRPEHCSGKQRTILPADRSGAPLQVGS